MDPSNTATDNSHGESRCYEASEDHVITTLPLLAEMMISGDPEILSNSTNDDFHGKSRSCKVSEEENPHVKVLPLMGKRQTPGGAQNPSKTTNGNSHGKSHSSWVSGDPDIATLPLLVKRPIPDDPQNPSNTTNGNFDAKSRSIRVSGDLDVTTIPLILPLTVKRPILEDQQNLSNTNLPLKTEDELNELKLTLPKEIWFNCYPMYLYQGFWCINLEPTIAFQTHFQAQPTDIFITSLRKTGTTWLKALVFSLFDRAIHPLSMSPLLTHNPHELIPQLESNIYAKSKCPLLKNDTSPRIFGTHLPYTSLPNSIKESNCKIIYICRNPLDTFISSWLFYLNYNENKTIEADMMGEYLEKFLEGKFPFGPFEDHILGYWEQRLARSEKVVFIKYEDLKANTKNQLKLLAEFLGCPFSGEEEELGLVDGIIELCDIKKLKEVEANKNGRVYHQIENKWFFRKGEVGDWVNYLTPSTAKRIEKIIEDKLACSGLTF